MEFGNYGRIESKIVHSFPFHQLSLLLANIFCHYSDPFTLYTPRPPSTSSVVPVMKELCSEARNQAALAMSVGAVSLCIGSVCSSLRRLSAASASDPMLFTSLFQVSGLSLMYWQGLCHVSRLGPCSTYMPVSPTAGQMQLKRMVGAYSSAMVFEAV